MRTRNIALLMVLVTITTIVLFRIFTIPRFDAIFRNDSVRHWVGVIVISACLLCMVVLIPCIFFLPRLLSIWKKVFLFGKKKRLMEQFALWTQDLPPRHKVAAEKMLSSLTRQQLERELMNVPPNRWEWLLIDWDRALAAKSYRQQFADWEQQRGQERSQGERKS